MTFLLLSVVVNGSNEKELSLTTVEALDLTGVERLVRSFTRTVKTGGKIVGVSLQATFRETNEEFNGLIDGPVGPTGSVLSLVSPQGTTVKLVRSMFLGYTDTLTIIVDDNNELSGSPSLTVTGELPLRPFESLSAFNGEDANGEWTFRLDFLPGRIGAFDKWLLNIVVEEDETSCGLLDFRCWFRFWNQRAHRS